MIHGEPAADREGNTRPTQREATTDRAAKDVIESGHTSERLIAGRWQFLRPPFELLTSEREEVRILDMQCKPLDDLNCIIETRLLNHCQRCSELAFLDEPRIAAHAPHPLACELEDTGAKSPSKALCVAFHIPEIVRKLHAEECEGSVCDRCME